MSQCECGSYAINPGINGRDKKTDLHLCDVCYWRKRAADHVSNLPHDVEGFISEFTDTVLVERDGGDDPTWVIFPDDLRAWMTGHVRVPVELLRRRFESPNTIDQCEAEAEFLALLHAIKEPS